MNAVPIQAQARCHIYRNRYLKTIKSVKFIHAWFQAYKRASAIRKGIYENEFPTWSIEETERRRLASEEVITCIINNHIPNIFYTNSYRLNNRVKQESKPL